MDPILAILLIAAGSAFILALIWSVTKPKSEPTIEPVENKPLPPIDEQIFDDVHVPPVIVDSYEEVIVETEPSEPEFEEEILDGPLPPHDYSQTEESEETLDVVIAEPEAEVNEDTNFDFEEEEKKNPPPPPPPPPPEPEPEPEPDISYESDSGGDDDDDW